VSDENKPEVKNEQATNAPADTSNESVAEAKQEAAQNQAADPAKQTTSEPSDSPAAELKGPSDEEKEAKAKAAAEARAARAAARAKAAGNAEGGAEEAEAPKAPSPNQPKLDRLVEILKEQVAEEAVDTAFINEKDGHTPYVVIRPEYLVAAAKVLKDHQELDLVYLRGITGIDQESHLECAYNLISLRDKQDYCIKVKTDREQASIPSVASVWASADWHEREIYDLLGIDFLGHPDMRRIMLPHDWVGHPLRKDYQALDPEV
jgi:NADH-quinone oxidoreductase subunit C